MTLSNNSQQSAINIVTKYTKPNTALSKREIEVLGLIAQGLSSQEAANNLYINKRTVDYHLNSAYVKLSVKNRVQAIRKASELGILQEH